jgi:hypothetical protein
MAARCGVSKTILRRQRASRGALNTDLDSLYESEPLALARSDGKEDDYPDHGAADQETEAIFHNRKDLAALPVGNAPEAILTSATTVGLEADQVQRQLVVFLARIGNCGAGTLRTLSVRH